MEVKFFLIILIYAIFFNNFVLTRALGVSPFWGGTGKINYPLCMGCVVISIMTLASCCAHFMFEYILVPYNAVHLRTVSFVLVIVFLTVCIDIIIKKTAFPFYQAMGLSFTVSLANCIVLGGGLVIANSVFAGRHNGIVQSVAQGFGGGAGFTIVLVIMAGIQERLESADLPGYLRGLPILFITMGLLSLAFLGFSGIIL